MDKQKTAVKTNDAALREGGMGLAFALIAFLLGQAELPFHTYPLGLSLLCAARQRIVWLLAGLSAAAFAAEGDPWARLIGCMISVGIRILARIFLDPPAHDENRPLSARLRALLSPSGRTGLFCESLTLRMATAAVSAFLVSVWAIVAGGYRYYDLFGAFLSITATPLFTLLFSFLFEPHRRGSVLWEGAAAGLIVSLCYAVREIEIFGISLVVFLAFIITLTVARETGIGRGAVIGVLCGLCVHPLYAPLFCIAACTAGLLWERAPTAAIVLPAIFGILWGGYVDGLMALLRLVPALVSGAIFVLSAERLGLFATAEDGTPTIGRGLAAIKQTRGWEGSENAVAAQRAESAEARMEALSETFSALSQVCYHLSDRLRRPGVVELRRVCDEACDRFCRDCRSQSLCWEREYGSTVDVLGKLTVELHGAGRASEACIPEYLRRRCPSMPAILEEINRGCARLWADLSRGDRTEVFAVDYEAVAAILSETLAAEQADFSVDEALTEEVRACAEKLNLGARGVLAYGGRRKQIIAEGLDLRRSGMGAEDLRRAFSEVCGFALTSPVLEIKEDLISMRFCTARRFTAEYVHRAAAAEEDQACGDSVVLFESPRTDCFYALISDGMGSGREAALTARLCTMFLEKMLASGNRRETALRLLNAFVRAKGLECSATIDLMELDLISGRASFLKSGAAPSFVRRGENLFKLQSKTVPIGIIRALDAEQLCFDIEPGDVIVMLSDGIVQSFEESVWLLDLLSCSWASADTLDMVAEKILDGAAQHNVRPDDRSVALIRIGREA